MFAKKTEVGLTQQASVRRGPRASATSLFTVSLAESEAFAFLPNRVCVSPMKMEFVEHIIFTVQEKSTDSQVWVLKSFSANENKSVDAVVDLYT